MGSQSHDSGPKHIQSRYREDAGKYSYGKEISIADCCLVLAVRGAQCYRVDTMPFNKIMNLYGRTMDESAVEKAHWRNQEDTPEEFKT